MTRGPEGEKSLINENIRIAPTQSEDEPNRLRPAQELSPEEYDSAAAKIRRKMDLSLLPMTWFMFVFNYFDRVSDVSTPAFANGGLISDMRRAPSLRQS